MKLIIRNLGVVKQIDVDLDKELTLFCGPNSTGKTYVSYVLNAFLDYSSYSNTQFSHIYSLLKNGQLSFTRQSLTDWLQLACTYVKKNLGTILGISDETRDKLFPHFELEPVLTDEDYQRTVGLFFELSFDSALGWRACKEAGECVVKVDIEWKKDADNENALRGISLLGLLYRTLTFGHMGGVRMLTVERNSIYTFKTELSLSRNELVDRIQQSAKINILDILHTSSRRYPLAIRNSLKVANDLETVQKMVSPYADIALRIEQDLLCGEVNMTKNGDVEFHAASMNSKRRLPFHLSSSIVKTMASLVIYLRHLALENDTLIIDEPEMNFHPDVQLLLARIFAMLVNRKLRIIISTHSDYIIREFNNLIMVDSLLCKQQADSIPLEEYVPEMSLAADKVQVLLFQYTPKRRSVTVKSQEILNTGFSVKTIDETIRRQNRIAQSLYEALMEEDADE